MITQVTVERLYNLGNYENIRLAATATVEDGQVELAWAEARVAVAEEYTRFQTAREEAERRQREEWEAEMARKRAEAEAERERRRQERETAESEDQPF